MEIEAMENTGIIELLDETFSVDTVKVFKPHTDVYEMVPDIPLHRTILIGAVQDQ